jgi:hypothetical protein
MKQFILLLTALSATVCMASRCAGKPFLVIIIKIKEAAQVVFERPPSHYLQRYLLLHHFFIDDGACIVDNDKINTGRLVGQ